MMVCKYCREPIEDESTARFAQEPQTIRTMGDTSVIYNMAECFHPDHLEPFMRTHKGWVEGKDL